MKQNSIDLLDSALDLAKIELNALKNAAYDDLMEFAEKMSPLIDKAWEIYDEKDRAAYTVRLKTLIQLQNQIILGATKAHTMLQSEMRKSKLEKRRMRGYQASISMAMQ
jgi:hypothetical protein